MLQRIEHTNGVVTYQSPLLNEIGVTHAFTTRIGGISTGPFASLNLGRMEKNASADGNGHIAENGRRLRSVLGLERHIRAEVRQAHGREVWIAPPTPIRPADAPQADAVIAKHAGIMPFIRTADCVPVLLACREGGVVAAVHAGWRGIVAGIAPATIGQMAAAFGIAAEDLVAAIGPCIGVEHYEVDRDVADQFAAADLSHSIDETRGDKPHLCLPSAVRLQLQRAGVAEAAIDTTDRCTYRDEEAFYSYRRDVLHRGHARTGHMAAVIAVRRDKT